MNNLIIANTEIRVDESGRYSLNDLHRAAGGESKFQPANWLRAQQAQDLIAAHDAQSIPQIRGIESKQGFGTFAAKPLVYAYAMWISAEFHLHVINAYDELVTDLARRSVEPHDRGYRDPKLSHLAGEFRGGLEIAELVGLTGNQRILAAASAVRKVTGQDVLELVDSKQLVNPDQVPHFKPTYLGKVHFGESAQAFNKRLERAGMQINEGKVWKETELGKPYAVWVDAGKSHNSGAPVLQLKWKESVVEALKSKAA
jgi:KilA-N domain